MNVVPQPAAPGARPRLEPGDRFPDFVLADQAGALWGLYQHGQGLPTAVFLDSDELLRTSLRELAAGYQAAQLNCVVVDGPGNSGAQADASPPRILADPTGRFRQGLRELSGQRIST